MRIAYPRAGWALAMAVALAACGGSGDDGPGADANVQANAGDDNAAREADLPNLVAEESADALPCPSGPGTMCVGPLIVRAEGLTLSADGAARSDGSRYLSVRGNLVFENRTRSPVRLAILDMPTDILLGNGIRLELARNGITGVHLCGRDGAECFQGTPEQFQTLAPGDSPARANISFYGRMDGSLAASLPSVSSGTVALQIYVVDASNVGSVLNISLPGAQVQNQLRQ